MYHLPGITPEAPTIDHATGGKPFQKQVMIDDKVLRDTYDLLNFRTTDVVDMVYLGCPHLNIVDLMQIAHKVDGKKCKVPVWIATAPWLYAAAKDQGYIDIFEKSGIVLMTGTCPAAMGSLPAGISCIAMDSAKQAIYLTGCYPNDDNRLQVCYGSQDDCIDAALTGKWRGEWR
jgi:predicted aconitase